MADTTAWEKLADRLGDRRQMARQVLESEGLGHVAALIPIEEVQDWVRELVPHDGSGPMPDQNAEDVPMRAPSVALAEIDAQREKGWSDFHPEDYCHRCGGRNVPSWFVDSDRFNAAFGPPDQHPYNGIVCPGCFVEAHEKATGLTATWMLVPDRTAHFRPAAALMDGSDDA